MGAITFWIVGGGWRSEFYLRIARELPARFAVSGMVVRDAAKGAAMQRRWGVKTVRTVEDLPRGAELDFVVLSVPWKTTPELILWFAERGIPVLAETPPAPDIAGLDALMAALKPGAKVQVAEQYPFQPHCAAMIAVAQGGRMGTVTQAQVSAAHGYHGMALIRKLLGIKTEPAKLRAFTFTAPLVGGPGRDAPPAREEVRPSSQTIAYLGFGDKLAVFDFTGDQYFSWIRSQRFLVRGERGEINNDTVRYLMDYRTPVRGRFVRENAGENGNLEGFCLKGILLGNEWVYRNPFPGARLSDDEIAVASCLEKMGGYGNGGEPFYSLAEGAYDHYLAILLGNAAKEGVEVEAPVPSWAR